MKVPSLEYAVAPGKFLSGSQFRINEPYLEGPKIALCVPMRKIAGEQQRQIWLPTEYSPATSPATPDEQPQQIFTPDGINTVAFAEPVGAENRRPVENKMRECGRANSAPMDSPWQLFFRPASSGGAEQGHEQRNEVFQDVVAERPLKLRNDECPETKPSVAPPWRGGRWFWIRDCGLWA